MDAARPLLLATLALALGVQTARAGRDFHLDHLQLAVTSGEFLATEGAGPRDPWTFRVGAAYSYSDSPLLATLGGTTTAVVGARSTLHLFGAASLGRWVGVGVEAPLLLAQTGSEGAGGASLGDLRLLGRLDAARLGDVRLAALVALRVPTGDTTRFLGEGHVVVEPRAVAEWSGAVVRVGVNVGARLREERRYGDLTVGHELFLAAALGVRPRPWIDAFAEVHADTALSGRFLHPSTSPVEVLVGGSGRARGFAATAAVGVGLVEGFGNPKVRLLVGLSYEPARRALPLAPIPERPRPKAPAPPPPPAVPPPATAPDLGVDPEEPSVAVGEDMVELADPVFFDTNRRRIRSRFHEELIELARAIQKRPWIQVLWIAGHADFTGRKEWNFRLSELRADEVRRFLVAHGLPAERVRTLGYGDTKPWFSNEQREGRAKNRRVVFLIERAQADGAGAAPMAAGAGW